MVSSSHGEGPALRQFTCGTRRGSEHTGRVAYGFSVKWNTVLQLRDRMGEEIWEREKTVSK